MNRKLSKKFKEKGVGELKTGLEKES